MSLSRVRYHGLRRRLHERAAREVPVEYRACPLFKTNIALGAVFQGRPGRRRKFEQCMRNYSEKRWASPAGRAKRRLHFQESRSHPGGQIGG